MGQAVFRHGIIDAVKCHADHLGAVTPGKRAAPSGEAPDSPLDSLSNWGIYYKGRSSAYASTILKAANTIIRQGGKLPGVSFDHLALWESVADAHFRGAAHRRAPLRQAES